MIQGTWRLSGSNTTSNGTIYAWFLEYTFDNGKFKLTGYPAITQKGSYRVIKQEENKLTLELYGQEGTFGKENKQIEIIFDKEAKKLTIDGKSGFHRPVANFAKTKCSNQTLSEAEAFLQGSWIHGGQNKDGRNGYFRIYKFDCGKFTLDGYWVNDKGDYKVISSNKDSLTLELNGVEDEKRTVEITLDKKKNKLSWDGTIYTRLRN